MPYLLKDLLIVSVWDLIVIFLIFIGVYISVYYRLSIKSGKSIVITTLERNDHEKSDNKNKVASNQDRLISADQYYFLPTASMVIKATAKVVVTKTDATDGIKTTAELVELQLENSVTIEPDTSQLFSLKYNPFSFANDELKLNINSSGLLESISATTEDRISNIIAEVSAAPKSVLSAQEFTVAAPAEIKIKNVTTQTLLFTNTFFILSEELQSGSFGRDWKINIDVTDSQSTIADASFRCTFTPKTISYEHLKIGDPKHGLLTRPFHKIKLAVEILDTTFKPQFPLQYEIMIPDHSVLIQVPVERANYVKKVQTPKFSNGLLVENYISKPSEVEGFLSIPINVLKAIFSIPAQLLSFKIAHIQQETALETARQNLAKAQLQSKINQDIKDREELKAKLEIDKQIVLAQKDLLGAKKDIFSIQNDLQKANSDFQSLKTDVDAGHSKNVPGDIIKEAIDQYGEDWKLKYDVIDISDGRKRINGIETNINCLVFRPKKKLENGQAAFIPIPGTINFIDKKNNPYPIPTDVQETGGPIIAAFIEDNNEACDQSRPKLPGCSVSRLNNDSTGTIGLKVYKNSRSYILSCYHVLCSSELKRGLSEFNPAIPSNDKIIISPGIEDGGTNRNVLGEVSEGKLTEFLDCALALLKDDLDVETRICRINQAPTNIVTVTLDHVHANYRVFMSGRTAKSVRCANIKSSYTSADIDYGIGTKTLRGLIATSSLAQRGDSGAAAFDENCSIIGIVVAASPAITYIIPISRILSEFDITIKK